MVIDEIYQPISDQSVISQRYISRWGFHFTEVTYPGIIFDAIIIKSPANVKCSSPMIQGSNRSLQEHIEFINKYKIEKALIIADDISFLKECPTLKYLRIIPSDSAGNNFDYSPVYKLPEVLDIQPVVIYGNKYEYATSIDYSLINGLQSAYASAPGHLNIDKVTTLKSLGLSGYKKPNLYGAFSSKILDSLTLIQTGLNTLEGIEFSEKIQCLDLWYNKSLSEISSLKSINQTLKSLRIENCPKIVDFSPISDLENLEYLELHGSNSIPNLEFISKMKSLKTFIFDINVEDGNLTPCKTLQYAKCRKVHRHYNLKDADLPKGTVHHGNETIDVWRRSE